uniref:outer membrane protein assembly factor BamB n=1 Tax=Thaumasiovibrio occultus TaxID=1891184 RepID=UPI000B350347|nr:outer membrane protein assembly factor BamB [Thaumasiovibrio occultus]
MKGMKQRLLGALVCSAILAGCAGEEATVQMAPLPNVSDAVSLDRQWSTSVGSGIDQFYSQLAPSYRYDKVFVADRDGTVKALSPETGKVIWQVELGDDKPARLSGGITTGFNRVIIGSENAELVSLDQETGELQWRVTTQGEILSNPLLDDGKVVVHTNRGVLEAFDVNSGEALWQFSGDVPNLTLRGDSSPISAGGAVFWGMASGRLGAAALENGQLLWQQPIATPRGATEIDRLVDVDSTPVIYGPRLFTVGFNGELVSIDLQSGQAAWRRPYSSAKDIAIEGQYLYLITAEDHVVAVDVRNGLELWRNTRLEYRELSAPAVIDGKVAVGDSEGYLHWLDGRSGDFVAQQSLGGDGIMVPPLAIDGDYLVTTRDGDVARYSISSL